MHTVYVMPADMLYRRNILHIFILSILLHITVFALVENSMDKYSNMRMEPDLGLLQYSTPACKIPPDIYKTLPRTYLVMKKNVYLRQRDGHLDSEVNHTLLYSILYIL